MPESTAVSRRGKLGLGTVQFGQAYGISNHRGQVPREEAHAIVAEARHAGIRLLDTAASYGEAEDVLASCDTSSVRIVTKTIGLDRGLERVIARARHSAALLKADTLLVHAAADLKGEAGDGLWLALERLKGEGIFRKIGISAYVEDGPLHLARRFHPDVMQVPFSILDQRLLADGTLGRLNELGVEVHARSLFLQGLLFLEKLPPKLRRVAAPLEDVRAHLRQAGIRSVAAALGFVLSRAEVAHALVGVTSLGQLKEILEVDDQPLPVLDWQRFALRDERLITPTRW